MVRPAVARVEWSPDGRHLLARAVDDRLALHDARGALLRPLGRALDARWADATHAVSIDGSGDLRWHGATGVEGYAFVNASVRVASLAAGARAVAVLNERHLAVARIARGAARGAAKPWELTLAHHGLPAPDRLSCVLADDGARLAVGYVGTGAIPGRGFVVLALPRGLPPREPARELVRDFVAIAADAMLDAPLQLAFAAGGERVLAIHPEAFPALGPLQLPARPGELCPLIRGHASGARAIAFAPSGTIAACAYSGGRVTFAFLAPECGPGVVPIVAELALATDVGEIAALGFAPGSREIACLGEEGAIEIVPVP